MRRTLGNHIVCCPGGDDGDVGAGSEELLAEKDEAKALIFYYAAMGVLHDAPTALGGTASEADMRIRAGAPEA